VLGRAPAQGRAGGSQGLSGGLAVDSGAGAAENWARGGPMVALERLTGGLPDLQHSPRKSGERLTDEHGRREGRYRWPRWPRVGSSWAWLQVGLRGWSGWVRRDFLEVGSLPLAVLRQPVRKHGWRPRSLHPLLRSTSFSAALTCAH